MTGVSALAGGLGLPAAAGGPCVAAGFSLDDWGLIAFFVIAGLIRLAEMLRGKGKKGAPAPRGEAPRPESPRGASRAPSPSPVPKPVPSEPHDPWRRSSPPIATPPPPRPAPRPMVHDVEGPEHTLVNLGAWKPHEFESERTAKDKAAGRTRLKAAPAPANDPRPVAGRALLVGALSTPRDRMRSAVVWKEVLDRPRRLKLRRPPSGP